MTMPNHIFERYVSELEAFSQISYIAPSITQECNDYFDKETGLYDAKFNIDNLFNYLDMLKERHASIQQLFEDSQDIIERQDLKQIARLRSHCSSLILLVGQYRPAYRIDDDYLKTVQTKEEYEKKSKNKELIQPQVYTIFN